MPYLFDFLDLLLSWNSLCYFTFNCLNITVAVINWCCVWIQTVQLWRYWKGFTNLFKCINHVCVLLPQRRFAFSLSMELHAFKLQLGLPCWKSWSLLTEFFSRFDLFFPRLRDSSVGGYDLNCIFLFSSYYFYGICALSFLSFFNLWFLFWFFIFGWYFITPHFAIDISFPHLLWEVWINYNLILFCSLVAIQELFRRELLS